MTTCPIDLGEYDIVSKPWVGIKAQVLANFLREMPKQKEKINVYAIKVHGLKTKAEIWVINDEHQILHTNGASSYDGSGVGVVLEFPTGEQVTYALHFNSKCSSHEAK